MTLEDLESIEGELQLTVPRWYREMLLNWPFKEESWGEVQLSKTKETIINDSKTCEVEDFPKALFIGHDGGEGLFFLDASDPEAPVYVWDMEDWTSQVAFSTSQEFLTFMSAPFGEMPDALK